MKLRHVTLVVLVSFPSLSATAEDAERSGEVLKAAAIAEFEADIEEATERKAQASKERDREGVKRLSQELSWLRLQLSKAKSQSPQQYAQEAAAAEEQATEEAKKKQKADEMVTFWADPKGRATVAAARLYRDLQVFRRKPDFVTFGFGQGGPYHSWLTAAETVAERDGKAGAMKLLESHDCVLGELASLGRAYATSRGKETPYTMDVERRLGAAMQAIEKEAEERAKEKTRAAAE